MRALAIAVAALTLLPLLPATPAQASPAPSLRITEILADPDTAAGQREFVEVWNPGPATVQLEGWKIRDAPTTSGSTNTYTFPAWSLPANGRLVVWGGGASDALGPAWSNSAVWNNAGDAVTVLDPSLAVVDWFGYGTGITAPSGFENRSIPAKATRGLSLELDTAMGAWSAHEPTPGSVPGATMGTATLEVQNVAPTASFGSLPASAKPGSQVSLPVRLADANGASDLASWRLMSGNTTLAQGPTPVDAVTVTAPATPGPWPVRIEATDKAGATGTGTATLAVRWSDLAVTLPAGGLQFPAVAPLGQAITMQGIQLRNDGDHALVPRMDVSPFHGPAGFEVEGRLSIGVTVDGATTWVPYGGPLTALPSLAAGGQAQLALRLDEVPAVPAGTYGTSFTVVA